MTPEQTETLAIVRIEREVSAAVEAACRGYQPQNLMPPPHRPARDQTLPEYEMELSIHDALLTRVAPQYREMLPRMIHDSLWDRLYGPDAAYPTCPPRPWPTDTTPESVDDRPNPVVDPPAIARERRRRV